MRRACLFCTILLTFLIPCEVFAQPVLADTGVAEIDTVYLGVQLGVPSVLIGVTLTEHDAAADPVRMLIYLPPFRGDSLCIEVVSRDGLYAGRFRFARYDEVGWRILILPTKHATLLRQHRTRRLAPLAHLSPTCDGEPGIFLPAGWGATPSSLRFRLLLNPESVERVTAEWQGVPGRSGCDPVEDPGPTAVFRYHCDLPGLSRPSGIREITVRQMNFDRGPDPFTISVWVPDDE